MDFLSLVASLPRLRFRNRLLVLARHTATPRPRRTIGNRDDFPGKGGGDTLGADSTNFGE